MGKVNTLIAKNLENRSARYLVIRRIMCHDGERSSW